MIEVKLTDREREILSFLREKASAEDRLYIDQFSLGIIKSENIEIVCRLINDEYLMKGIEENFEPNEYGKELARLLDLVNKPRLTKS